MLLLDFLLKSLYLLQRYRIFIFCFNPKVIKNMVLQTGCQERGERSVLEEFRRKTLLSNFRHVYKVGFLLLKFLF